MCIRGRGSGVDAAVAVAREAADRRSGSIDCGSGPRRSGECAPSARQASSRTSGSVRTRGRGGEEAREQEEVGGREGVGEGHVLLVALMADSGGEERRSVPCGPLSKRGLPAHSCPRSRVGRGAFAPRGFIDYYYYFGTGDLLTGEVFGIYLSLVADTRLALGLGSCLPPAGEGVGEGRRAGGGGRGRGRTSIGVKWKNVMDRQRPRNTIRQLYKARMRGAHSLEC